LNRSHVHRWASLALVVAACVVVAGGTPPDDEEFRYAVLTSWLHVRALSEGTYAFWTSRLALGLPQPFIPNFWFHPLLPILAVVEPANWVRLLLLAHTVLGAAGMWQVGRTLGFRPTVRAICTFTFLLAAPGINYALNDAWPSHWIVWTSMPWLLLCLWRTLEGDGRDRWRSSVLLGLISGLVIANANPAYAVVYAVLVAAVIIARWHDLIARWRPLSVSAAIAFLIVSPNAALLVSERGFFASRLGLQSTLVRCRRPLPGTYSSGRGAILGRRLGCPLTMTLERCPSAVRSRSSQSPRVFAADGIGANSYLDSRSVWRSCLRRSARFRSYRSAISSGIR
jgi:hypothetical protein